MKESVVIAGAGPAGLTAALELLNHSEIAPVVFEVSDQVGGISKTINYRGNRLDLGGHRFFSKSDWVMDWWRKILPIAVEELGSDQDLRIRYQNRSRALSADIAITSGSDMVMLVRERLSRIYYRRRFFDYPLTLNAKTLRNIGFLESLLIGFSYARAQLTPNKKEDTLEEFFCNRFGDRLYRTFFKSYTEKVWGVPCHEISAEWGAQRIKGLSIRKALTHALAKLLRPPNGLGRGQNRTETSLIERFLYPKLGPGQMWEEVARQIRERGGDIHLRHRIVGVTHQGSRITAVDARNESDGSITRIPCDQFISSMPICDLIALLNPEDTGIATVADNLPYRDFMTVGLLVKKMKDASVQQRHSENGMPPDNWIYIQEPGVKIGRLQIFNNWSVSMVADPATIWLGLEYFCKEGDELWSMADEKFIDFAIGELQELGMLDRNDVLDGTVVRVPKAYPAYFGEYRKFGRVREYLDTFENLYPVGRNGMHRYNNQDHSMLSARDAVKSILSNGRIKLNLWSINAEADYLEEAPER